MAKANEAKEMGRPRETFSHQEITETLRLMRLGYGRAQACAAQRIGYGRFLRELRENDDFAERVREVEVARVEACEAALLDLAKLKYDSPLKLRAAIAYLTRHDRIDEARRARKAKRDASASRKAGAGETG